MVNVNITALMQMTYCFLKPMIERGKGKILNVSSVAAFCAGPDMSVYYASKAFVRSFSEAVAEEVKGTGVTVTAVCPGPTETDFAKAASMGSRPMMFRHAAKAETAASEALREMEKGSVLLYQGTFTKVMNFGARILPRALTRKFAEIMNH